MGAEMLWKDEGTQADGRMDSWTDKKTDMAKLIVAFRNFANASKNRLWHVGVYNRDSKCLTGTDSINTIQFNLSL